MNKCKDCKYRHTPQLNVNFCIRFPPTIMGMAQNGSPVSSFPPIHAEMSCGEFKPKVTVDATDIVQ